MNIKSKLNSLNIKTLEYLIIFSVSILIILSVVQNIFFNIYYEKYQIQSLKNLANEIATINENDIFYTIEAMSFDSSICLEYVDIYNNSYYYNNKFSGCLLGKNNPLEKYKKQLSESKEIIKGIKLINPNNNTESLLYSVKVGKGYVYLFTALEDVGTPSSLLRSQLIYITLLAIIFAIIIAMFISKKIAKPITDITNQAKKLAEGNYDVHFAESGIAEIDELSNTLNYLESEVSKTDTYRRDLMANVSHDLKTPLTMIKAYAEMIRDISYKDDIKRNQHLNVIIDEADRLNVLVNDILELSKLQSHVGELTIKEFDLVSLINDILKRYDIIKETENYDLVFESPKKVIIRADQKRLSQVLYNLINNAINYTGDDKKVTIKISSNKNNYLVEIIDTGKGISDEDLPNIWTKYYKKDKNHRRNIIGTGLGLSIVKNILEEHNFEYGVKSLKDKGSTFYFIIPKIKTKKTIKQKR